MWSPLRARKVSKDGSLEPFVPFETFGNPKTLNCDKTLKVTYILQICQFQ